MKKEKIKDKFPGNRIEAGSGAIYKYSCEEVQKFLLQISKGQHPDIDTEAIVCAHTLLCESCFAYVEEILKQREEKEQRKKETNQ